MHSAVTLAPAVGRLVLRELANRTVESALTGLPPRPLQRLVEAFVHGEDIRRPFGICHDYPQTFVVRAIKLQARVSSEFGGGKTKVAGLTLTATDTDFTLGTGPVVEGPAIALLLATSGRKCALADLAGPGVQQIAQRT